MAKITQITNGLDGNTARERINEAMKTVSTDSSLSGDGTLASPLSAQDAIDQKPFDEAVFLSDMTTDLTTGASKAYFRAPFAFTLTSVRASVIEAPVGDTIEVDVNKNGTTVFSTVLSIDAGEKTSTTAANPAVISDSAISDDDELTFDIDQIGSTTAGKGLIVRIYGTPT